MCNGKDGDKSNAIRRKPLKQGSPDVLYAGSEFATISSIQRCEIIGETSVAFDERDFSRLT